MLGLASGGLLVIGRTWNRWYVPHFLAAATILAIAGLIFAVASPPLAG
ncbi:hypothetical protein EV644_1424 [Kribbella orskensis]|uniref:Major facilitator superfamily (MFS) profile domain-containing protein n=1 Tax=Kribbella orskensis TaxID=2512216 RepID=A0ABY2B6I6_9ACTN|nr:hypothetical protein EV642_1454 [Kribbella sp. VKM Ac-2500]TCO08972.1 hypothetical protein EV644_1424 [Kribbella orskensis]